MMPAIAPDSRPLTMTIHTHSDGCWRYRVEGMMLDLEQVSSWLLSQINTGRFTPRSTIVVQRTVTASELIDPARLPEPAA